MPRDGRTLSHNILEEMRFRAIEAYQAGKGVAEIAKLLGVHWGSVSRWLTKWRRDGQQALKERKATGRPPKLDCKRHGKAILKLVKHPATGQDSDSSRYGQESQRTSHERSEPARSIVF